jgi:HAE1 family hydrophobic/amphiphilic exporter-1
MKIANLCVRYPVFTVMLIAFLVTLGIFSYRGLAVDLFPKADPATINVSVSLPGATPDEMVTGVVLPLEDAISSVSGIDEISVYATEGRADITCTFVLERDIEGAAWPPPSIDCRAKRCLRSSPKKIRNRIRS